MSTGEPQLDVLLGRGYQHGFVTDIESDTVPPGLDEEVIRGISRRKSEPQFLLDWRLRALERWLTMREPHWAKVNYPPIDYQAISYYSAPKAKTDGPKSLSEVDPKLLATYEKLGVPLHERARLAGVAVDAVFDSVSVATTFKDRLAAGRRGVLPVLRGGADASGTDRAVPGQRRALCRQFLRGAQFGGVHRRLVRLHPAGRALPHGAVHVFPHQRRQHRPVRAHADHRRRRQPRELPRRLHGAHARREPAARGGGGTGGAGRRPDQVLHGAELVSRAMPHGTRRHLQLRHQARRMPRPQLEDLLDPGGNRLGHHLEIPQLRAARREFRGRVLFRGADQQLPAGRHRHQDDPPRAPTRAAPSSPRASRPATRRTPIAAWCR